MGITYRIHEAAEQPGVELNSTEVMDFILKHCSNTLYQIIHQGDLMKLKEDHWAALIQGTLTAESELKDYKEGKKGRSAKSTVMS